jgi:AsmA protein
MRRRLLIVVAVTSVGVLAIGATAVSLLVNVDRFRPQLARAMSAALGREVGIGHISLSLLSASAVVEDLSIADDAAFGKTPFVTARTVRVGIAVLPLVRSKHLRIESLRLHEPHVTLRRSAAGAWNFSTLGASSAGAPSDLPSSSSSSLTLSIDRLTIDRGEIALETAAARTSRHVYEDVAVDVRDFSSTSPFRFTINLVSPGGGRVKLQGTAGPLGASGLGSTPLDAALDATRVDVARSGFVDPAAGIGGIVDLHLRIASNGARITSSGTLRGDRFQLVPGASPASRAIEAAYASEYDLSTRDGVVSRGDVHLGGATARLLGRFSTRAATPAVRLTLTGQRMPLADLQALLPAVGAPLPRGAKFQSGGLDVNLTATGPIDRLVIAGPVAISDATLTGFDLGSRMQAVASLAGLRPADETTIQTLGVTLRVAADGIRADQLICVLPAIGSLEGAGTVAPNGTLDFRMLATLLRTTGAAGQLARVASIGHPESGVPFRVTGTTTSPQFVPDISRAASDAIKRDGASKATGFLRSLFHRDERR